ncbi:class II aldolase/adducin family protein [Patescibacteria group bacterium]|nr:class II aldolase/adducin family protein [Patescibacteria group bacterium]
MSKHIKDLITLAQHIGARPDYTQGGGGNVSMKDAAAMLVKASGLRLSELTDASHFVTIDHKAVRDWHDEVILETPLPELIAAGDSAINATILASGGGRPSIETGFHALLGETVLHTHSVYANILMCAHEGEALMRTLFPEAAFIPYNTPGVALTLAIKAAGATEGSDIIFLENHGLIIVAPTPDEAQRKHEEVNEKLRLYFALTDSYPTLAIASNETGWESNSVALKNRIMGNPETLFTFKDTILFPDQVVYGDAISYEPTAPDKITIDPVTGSITYACSEKEALAIEETLAAWLYIHDTVTEKGLTLKTLAAAEGVFIANLDSEKYRKSIL